jgi:very-short-patch-repair endonuclease
MTDAEQAFWFRVRRKQFAGIQFYRQKPLGKYVVDFYAPKANLVVELDGSQHMGPKHQEEDASRTIFLQKQGLRVLRFDDRQVLSEMDAVLEAILAYVQVEGI